MNEFQVAEEGLDRSMEGDLRTEAPHELISWDEFRGKYNLPDESLEKSGLDWVEYCQIYRTHRQNRETHKVFSKQICDSLSRLPQLYSLKSRIKHPEHLIAKILRKNCGARGLSDEAKLRGPESVSRITLKNFEEQVTDLVGVRILTLLKAEKQLIHHGLVQAWEPLEKTCNYRRGDPLDAFAFLKKQGFSLKEHPDGYRAWHYLVEGSLGGRKCTAEIQVRTVFEDAWSEIDHRLRYPDALKDQTVKGYLMMMNRLAGAADSLASVVWELRQTTENRRQNDSVLRERHRKIEAQLQTLGVDAVHNFCSKCGSALETLSLIPTCCVCLQSSAAESRKGPLSGVEN